MQLMSYEIYIPIENISDVNSNKILSFCRIRIACSSAFLSFSGSLRTCQFDLGIVFESFLKMYIDLLRG